MAHVLRMPGVAANATEAVLAEWVVGDSVDFAAGDALATVETEKALVDVEAEEAGRVVKTLVSPGAQVRVGDPIAVLGAPGEEVYDLDALLASLGVSELTDVVVPARRDVPSDPGSGAPVVEVPEPAIEADPPLVAPPEPAIEAALPAVRPSSPPSGGRIYASPLARKLAVNAGLAIEDIRGTGPRGRILRRDVDAAAAIGTRSLEPAMQASDLVGGQTTQPSSTPPPSESGARTAAYQEIPHTRVRLSIASRLVQSKQTAPHFYLRATVHAEALLALRAEINDGGNPRVSINDLIIKAVATAHQRVPEMNVTWAPEAVRQYGSVDIAIAISTDRGLVSPVLRDTAAMTIRSVTTHVQELTSRARNSRLKQWELEGGSITVTNLGMYGVREFAAILNPPQAAILAVGAVRDEPVVCHGAIVPGKVMTLTLSVDHRPVDGVLASRWLALLVELLEHPVRLLA